MKGYKKALIASVATVGVSCALIGGATFALFTSETTTNIAITTGDVKVTAEIGDIVTSSYDFNGSEYVTNTYDGAFTNGGYANINAGTLEIIGMTPGDAVNFPITVKNLSTVDIMYRVKIEITEGETIFSQLSFVVEDSEGELEIKEYSAKLRASSWAFMGAPTSANETLAVLDVTVALPHESTKQSNETCRMEIAVEAIQGNAETGDIIVIDEGDAAANGKALKSAIEQAGDGDTIILAEDTTIEGNAATNQLFITSAVTLDLNGNTLTSECGWGGISAKGGCTIKNGTIDHTGNTAAVKAFQVEAIENVEIILHESFDEKGNPKTKAGIVVQEGPGCYIGSIKNVTIKGDGVTNGIQTYLCGYRTEESPYAIGSMENVTIEAVETGMLLCAPVGTVTNCDIYGAKYGIDMQLKGTYSVSIDLVNCKVSGGTYGIWAHDEWNDFANYVGTVTINYDEDTVINSIYTDFGPNSYDKVTINGESIEPRKNG